MRKFRCFEPLPRGVVRNGHKLEAWPLISEWHAHLEAKYRVPLHREGAAVSIAARRQARGEDPETGVPIPAASVKAQSDATWLVALGMAVAVFIVCLY